MNNYPQPLITPVLLYGGCCCVIVDCDHSCAGYSSCVGDGGRRAAGGRAVLALPGVRSVRPSVRPFVRSSIHVVPGYSGVPRVTSVGGVAPAVRAPAESPCPQRSKASGSGLCACVRWCRGSGRRQPPTLGLPAVRPIRAKHHKYFTCPSSSRVFSTCSTVYPSSMSILRYVSMTSSGTHPEQPR